eukprot:CAMPEP_0197664166 /NCGR_PEP_ID=MMETSP1338-20131121/58468_1 /TAXON_ID=43686 ORGANISM="Pelagodinium beii, Strain RCC1491" /NCGR_SAMPLE_ID=MMETSP1338 /ASSEMBLY_ACC=CAM_ASM_000754 /LENGTH=556 /DNA_ID=CAMNT_0043242747 /DNA_START=6 /DNA_END=1673 /DNA_ORIENTATION=+
MQRQLCWVDYEILRPEVQEFVSLLDASALRLLRESEPVQGKDKLAQILRVEARSGLGNASAYTTVAFKDVSKNQSVQLCEARAFANAGGKSTAQSCHAGRGSQLVLITFPSAHEVDLLLAEEAELAEERDCELGQLQEMEHFHSTEVEYLLSFDPWAQCSPDFHWKEEGNIWVLSNSYGYLRCRQTRLPKCNPYTPHMDHGAREYACSMLLSLPTSTAYHRATLMGALLSRVTWPLSGSRQNVRGDQIDLIHAFACGLVEQFTGEKKPKMSASTCCGRELVLASAAWMRLHDPNFPFTSIQFNKDYAAKRHRDHLNFKRTRSYCISFGDFEGGELMAKTGASFSEVLCKHQMVAFEGQHEHEVKPFKGTRFSCVFFCSGAVEMLLQSPAKLLIELASEMITTWFSLPEEIWKALSEAPSKAAEPEVAALQDADTCGLAEVFQEAFAFIFREWCDSLRSFHRTSSANWQYMQELSQELLPQSNDIIKTRLQLEREGLQTMIDRVEVFKRARSQLQELMKEFVCGKRRRCADFQERPDSLAAGLIMKWLANSGMDCCE